MTNPDDWTWETNEVCDWIINDEYLYTHAQHVDARVLEALVKEMLPDLEVDWFQVDWDVIVEYLDDDEDEYMDQTQSDLTLPEDWHSAKIGGINEDFGQEEAPDPAAGTGSEEEASQAVRDPAQDVDWTKLWWPDASHAIGVWNDLSNAEEEGWVPVEMGDAPKIWQGQIGNVQLAAQYGQYSDIFDATAALVNKIQRLQAAPTANKRTGSFLGLYFLEQNGIDTMPLQDEGHLQEYIRLVNGLSDAADYRTTEQELAEFFRNIFEHGSGDPGWWQTIPMGRPSKTGAQVKSYDLNEGDLLDVNGTIKRVRRVTIAGGVTMIDFDDGTAADFSMGDVVETIEPVQQEGTDFALPPSLLEQFKARGWCPKCRGRLIPDEPGEYACEACNFHTQSEPNWPREPEPPMKEARTASCPPIFSRATLSSNESSMASVPRSSWRILADSVRDERTTEGPGLDRDRGRGFRDSLESRDEAGREYTHKPKEIWIDSEGHKLEEGEDYEMHSGHYAIPDRITVEKITPDKLHFLLHSGDLDYRNTISIEEVDTWQYRFEPVDIDADFEDSTTDPGTRPDEDPIRPGADALPQVTDLADTPTKVSAKQGVEVTVIWTKEGAPDLNTQELYRNNSLDEADRQLDDWHAQYQQSQVFATIVEARTFLASFTPEQREQMTVQITINGVGRSFQNAEYFMTSPSNDEEWTKRWAEEAAMMQAEQDALARRQETQGEYPGEEEFAFRETRVWLFGIYDSRGGTIAVEASSQQSAIAKFIMESGMDPEGGIGMMGDNRAVAEHIRGFMPGLDESMEEAAQLAISYGAQRQEDGSFVLAGHLPNEEAAELDGGYRGGWSAEERDPYADANVLVISGQLVWAWDPNPIESDYNWGDDAFGFLLYTSDDSMGAVNTIPAEWTPAPAPVLTR